MLAFDDTRLTLPIGGTRQAMQVSAGVVALRKTPTPDGTQVSQALHGETVLLHHEEGEFGLIQWYVGWALMGRDGSAFRTRISADTSGDCRAPAHLC